ncbi:twin-arginine translocation signal domain-containing protein [Bifidobacterium sp. W8106]|nr:twin-arginine translocation signal domain-containing protein [Bifidobacterium choladohabitans]MBI0147600.1 twin-arginine translocation signal domain-containing protein [Bifidobacterium sp. W8104]MBI0150531.1 twin-arginine translocation signal domain-containing protein [Bifidobacterium sp. M0353]
MSSCSSRTCASFSRRDFLAALGASGGAGGAGGAPMGSAS